MLDIKVTWGDYKTPIIIVASLLILGYFLGVTVHGLFAFLAFVGYPAIVIGGQAFQSRKIQGIGILCFVVGISVLSTMQSSPSIEQLWVLVVALLVIGLVTACLSFPSKGFGR